MTAEQSLSRVLESLYDKTGTPEEWPELLGEIVSYTGGEVGKLIVGDLHGDQPRLLAVLCKFSPSIRRAILSVICCHPQGPFPFRWNLNGARSGCLAQNSAMARLTSPRAIRSARARCVPVRRPMT